MPEQLMQINQVIELEEERGQRVRRTEDKEENPNLKNSIDRRWKAARHFIELPESEQKAFISSITGQIRIHRRLFEEILGKEGTPDQAIERLLNREIHPVELALLVNGYLQTYLAGKPDEVVVNEETLIALVTRNLAEELLARVEKNKKQQILDVDRGGISVDEKEFGKPATSINDMIDNSKEDLEHTIRKILRFLKKHVFAKKTDDVSFDLVNEKNDYGEEKYFTYIPSEGESGKSEGNGNTLVQPQLKPGEPHYDQQTHSIHMMLANDGKNLGIMTIRLKDKAEFDEHDMEMLQQIGSRLDTYIHLELMGRTIEKAVEEGEDILEQNKLQSDFENGIREVAALTCRRSRAKKAMVIFKKPGLTEEIMAQTYDKNGVAQNMDLEPTLAKLLCEHEANVISVDHINSGQVFGDNIRAENLVYRDLVDISQPIHPVIGKMILINEDETLTNEERRLLDQTTGLIDAHISRRKMNLALLSKTMDPKVAEALSNGELKENSREKVTMVFVDIAAYTEKCQKLSQLGHGDKIFRLAETFLSRVQQIGQKYGGIWDNAAGDCGILLFGPPYYKNGKDGLGLTKEDKHRDEYHAVNALKTHLAIQKALADMNAEYEKMLIEVAQSVYRHTNTPIDFTQVTNEESRKKHLLQKLGREYQLKPTIEVTTGIYSGEANVGVVNLPNAQKYTVLDDGMNMAARYQAGAFAGEALVPLKTKNFLKRCIDGEQEVPLDANGKTQTWEEFLADDLGIDINKEKLEIDFIEEYYFMKSTRGPNLGYRVKTHLISNDSKRQTIQPGQEMTEQELLAHEGEYAVVSTNTHQSENVVILDLRTLNQPHVHFKAKIALGKITRSEKPRLVSEQDSHRRGEDDEDHILVVRNYHLETYVYGSIENKLVATLETDRLLNDDEVPVGLYEVLNIVPDKNSPDYVIYNLRKGDKTFTARIPVQRVNPQEYSVRIKENSELLHKFNDHFYAFEKSSSKRGPGWLPPQELIYIQGSAYYTMPISGIPNAA